MNNQLTTVCTQYVLWSLCILCSWLVYAVSAYTLVGNLDVYLFSCKLLHTIAFMHYHKHSELG